MFRHRSASRQLEFDARAAWQMDEKAAGNGPIHRYGLFSRPVMSLVARHSCKNGESPGAGVRLFSLA